MVGTKYTGEVKNSLGNGETKELICMIHVYELREGRCWCEGVVEQRGIKGKKLYECNSMVNKHIIKK